MNPLRRLNILHNRATHRLRQVPVVTFMAHSRCNCQCVMCDIWKDNRIRNEISTEQIATWLPALRRLGVEQVVWSGGEALLHSDLWALVRGLGALDAAHTLLTTGLLLERHADDIAQYCASVIVSLDGPGDVHDRVRGVPGATDKISRGVAALKQRDPTLHVAARCVLQKANHDVIGATVDAARTLGFDGISFLAADVQTGAFNHNPATIASDAMGIVPSAEETARLADDMELLINTRPELFRSRFVMESPDRLRGIARYYQALYGPSERLPVRCNAPWTSMVIETDGTVRPCFFHAAYGDAGTDFEVINGPGARDFRRKLDVATDPTCRGCVCTLDL